MNWFLAKMVFRIICGDGEHTAQFDEQLRLIQAGSMEEAFHKVQALGGREEEAFFNQRQQLVQWQYVSVSELYQLNDLIDGAELYSRIEERENADAYMHIVHARANQIRFGNAVNEMNFS
jgi:hypothetical protein